MLRKVKSNNFYSQEKEEFLLENDFDKIKAYKLKQTGQVVFEYEIDAKIPQIVAPGNPYFERGCFVRIKIS